METKLLTCPFCGCEAEINKIADGQYYVECSNFYCWVVPSTDICSTKEKAIELWNTRKHPLDSDVLQIFFEAIEEWNKREPMGEIVEKIEKLRDSVENVDFKNGCNACLVELSRK